MKTRRDRRIARLSPRFATQDRLGHCLGSSCPQKRLCSWRRRLQPTRLLRPLRVGRFVPLLASATWPVDAFRRTPFRLWHWTFGIGTGECGIGTISETGFYSQSRTCAPRSSSRADPLFARPIFRAAHDRKHPLQSSDPQSTSCRMSSTTLRATESRPLTSRLCAGVLDAAADDGIQFAAGRAAVKPACRFRQARGLRRGSEYGSSVQSKNPAGL